MEKLLSFLVLCIVLHAGNGKLVCLKDLVFILLVWSPDDWSTPSTVVQSPWYKFKFHILR